MKELRALVHSILRYLRSCVDHLVFFCPTLPDLVFGLVTGIATLISGIALIDWTDLNWSVGKILSNSGTLLGLFLLIRSILDGVVTMRLDLRIDPPERDLQERLLGFYKKSPWHQVILTGNQAIVYEPAVCRLLESANNPIRILRGRYALPKAVEAIRWKLLLKAPGRQWDTFNDRKIRLCTTPSPSALHRGEEIVLQRTDYFRDRLTNHLAGHTITIERLPCFRIGEWNLDSDGSMKSFETSVLSNQIGGSALLITADHRIIFVRQGSRSDENRCNLAPAGSGSFDWRDLTRVSREDRPSLQRLVKCAIFRELVEEVGLRADESECLVRLTGFGRLLYRGGKPDFCALVCTRQRFHDLDVPPREYDYIDRRIEQRELRDLTSPEGLIEGFNSFLSYLEVESRQVSGPLLFTARLTLEALQNQLGEEVASWYRDSRSRNN